MATEAPTWLNKWRIRDAEHRSLWRRMTGPQLFVASFFFLILFGTLGFKLLPSLFVGERIGWLDSLLMATSASCVTGLTVVDVGRDLTFWGQLFLLGLVQLGGLGIITFTSVIIVALGKRLSLRGESISVSGAEVAPHVHRPSLVRDIILFTFAIEAIGTVALFLLWAPDMGWQQAIWPSIFHAVSAFCNAGFSTFPDSLVGHQHAPATLLVIGGLIIAGGLGFLTLEELRLWYRSRHQQRFFRLSIHSRLVLIVTGVLLVVGTAVFLTFEWNESLKGLPVGDKVANAFFLATTPRTAGFASVDYLKARDASNFFTVLLMFVGGSPGSTAGGIKTTALALIFLLGWSRLRGHTLTSIWGRSIPNETIQRAVGLALMAFIVQTLAILLLTLTELTHEDTGGLLRCMFEVASAFNTVGSSMDLTPRLTAIGRWTVVILMFVGRVGPLTFAAALARNAGSMAKFRFAYEDVIVG